MATLNLTDGYQTLVWRVIKAAIEADSAYANAGFRVVFFDSETGRDAIRDLDSWQGPALLFSPLSGPQTWWDESGLVGTLQVTVDARLTVLDIEDVFNLSHALEDTLNTIKDAHILERDLVTAGATVGQILVNQPLRPSPGSVGNDGFFRLTGMFSIDVRRPLLP